MVGTANVLNERPRSGSKRFTAFTRPTSATCPRSSRLSPRWAKRRAQNDASQLNSSTRALRMSRSPVARHEREPGVDLVVSGSGWLVQRSSLGAMLRRTRRLPTGEPLTQNRFGESRFDCCEKRFRTRKCRSSAVSRPAGYSVTVASSVTELINRMAPTVTSARPQRRGADVAADRPAPPVHGVDDDLVGLVAGQAGADRVAQLAQRQADVEVHQMIALDLVGAEAPQLLARAGSRPGSARRGRRPRPPSAGSSGSPRGTR